MVDDFVVVGTALGIIYEIDPFIILLFYYLLMNEGRFWNFFYGFVFAELERYFSEIFAALLFCGH